MVYIRPVCNSDDQLKGLALCRVKDKPLIDGDIISHFPANTPGVEIKAMAVEFGHAENEDCVEWAQPLYYK